jgi:epoxide hydrolase 4
MLKDLYWAVLGQFQSKPKPKNKKETLMNQSKNVSSSVMIDLDDAVMDGYADSNGVKIHYASLGKGQLIHGIPELWYTWRHQMEGLAATGKYQVVAIDHRGYNLSDKPKGKEN